MRKCQMAISKGSKKNQRKSKNPLDKPPKVWYNEYTRLRESQATKKCALKPEFEKSRKKIKKIKKGLDKIRNL